VTDDGAVTFALIPVKELPLAKARLAPALHATARRELALAFFHDVLDAAMACPDIDGVTVVSRDPHVVTVTGAQGASWLSEAGDLNETLMSAASDVRLRGVERIVVLSSDLPLATADAISRFVQHGGDVVLVPSRDGGTNAMLCPTGAFALAYGPGSAQKHIDAAQAAGLRVELVDEPALALDIDAPEDIGRLLSAIAGGAKAGAHTLAALARLGLIDESLHVP
jgi:2-phospho-L-lactate guanylyltransferase